MADQKSEVCASLHPVSGKIHDTTLYHAFFDGCGFFIVLMATALTHLMNRTRKLRCFGGLRTDGDLSSPIWGRVGLALDGLISNGAVSFLPLPGPCSYLVPWIVIARTATKTVGITIVTVMFDNLCLFSTLKS